MNTETPRKDTLIIKTNKWWDLYHLRVLCNGMHNGSNLDSDDEDYTLDNYTTLDFEFLTSSDNIFKMIFIKSIIEKNGFEIIQDESYFLVLEGLNIEKDTNIIRGEEYSILTNIPWDLFHDDEKCFNYTFNLLEKRKKEKEEQEDKFNRTIDLKLLEIIKDKLDIAEIYKDLEKFKN